MEINRSRGGDISRESRQVILVDASFVMMAVQLGKDLFSELEVALGPAKLLTVKQVIEELERLARGGGKRSKEAKLALELIKNAEVAVVDPRLKSDEAIIHLAISTDVIVATTDWDLVKQLRDKGVRIAYIKDGFVKIEG